MAAVLLIVVVSASVTSWRWWERRQSGEFTRNGGHEDLGSCTWAAPREKGTQEDLPGLGEEAFLRFGPTDPGKNITARVVFRRSNMEL